MKNFINKIILSFENSKDGFSARKLTAFILILCICYIHFKFVDLQNAVEVLIIDLCGVLIALGIVTAQNIIELKNGSTNTKPPSTTES